MEQQPLLDGFRHAKFIARVWFEFEPEVATAPTGGAAFTKRVLFRPPAPSSVNQTQPIADSASFAIGVEFFPGDCNAAVFLIRRNSMRLTLVFFLVSVMLPSLSRAQGPVFTITPEESDIKFFVKASVAIDGKFDKWEATLTFPSPEVESAVLDIKISADSVNTGSGMKDNKLRSKDFFNAKDDPYITFHSTKVVQTGPATFDVPGTFTIRGVSKPETLNLVLAGKGTGDGSIKGTMAFDRKEFGMNSGIPFIKIADRVEVSLALKAHKVSGPPVVSKE